MTPNILKKIINNSPLSGPQDFLQQKGDWGISGVRQWRTYCVSMAYLWRTFGVSMAYLWRIHGVPFMYSWRTFGVSIAYPWRTFKKGNCDDQFGTKCKVKKN